MAISNNERAPTLNGLIEDSIKKELANLWTALPCIVDKYNPDAVTVDVQPAIRIPIRKQDGTIKTIEMPLLLDVPVMFPCAGGFTITHPIKRGDECLVTFSDRCIDLWWQSGGIQNPFDMRKHDLSDGFAFFKPQSQSKKISGISTENLEIRTDDNVCKIQITPSGEIHFIGSKSVFHTPVEMQKTLQVTGDLTMQSGMTVKGKSNMTGGAKIGDIEFDEHKHGGIQKGSSDSDGPK